MFVFVVQLSFSVFFLLKNCPQESRGLKLSKSCFFNFPILFFHFSKFFLSLQTVLLFMRLIHALVSSDFFDRKLSLVMNRNFNELLSIFFFLLLLFPLLFNFFMSIFFVSDDLISFVPLFDLFFSFFSPLF